MNVGRQARNGLRFYAATEDGDVDITDILNPEMELADLGAWASAQNLTLAFRTPAVRGEEQRHQPSRR